MSEFISFLLVISSGLFFSGLFKRFDIPYVTALIIAGIAIGPFGLNIFEATPAIFLIASIGAIFLMFMAGLEVQIKKPEDIKRETITMFLLNSVIPFCTGFIIAAFFGFALITSLIMGILFMSSSIALLVPQLKKTGLINKNLGKTILTSVIFSDIVSLLLLSAVFQMAFPKTGMPLPAYIFVILISIMVMKFAFPKARKIYLSLIDTKDTYEKELQFLFVLLIGSAVFFEALGMHAIIAGFIVGMVLSETVSHKKVIIKLHTLSYGLLIPVFFVILGAGVDLNVFIQDNSALIVMAVIIFGLIISKTLSGFLAGKISGMTNLESAIMGVSTTPQLSTTLAAAFAAQQFGLLDSTIIASLIGLSIVTTLLSPVTLNMLNKKLVKKSEKQDKKPKK